MNENKEKELEEYLNKKSKLMESKEYKNADEIQKTEFKLALHLRHILKLD